MHKFFAKHKDELEQIFMAHLLWFMPPFLRMYHELRSQTQSGKKTVTIMPDELATSLGYEVDLVQGILKNMSQLDVIDCKPGRNAHEKWTITILVI